MLGIVLQIQHLLLIVAILSGPAEAFLTGRAGREKRTRAHVRAIA